MSHTNLLIPNARVITLNRRKPLDFEIVKEDWNKYTIHDGSKLKTRLVLESVSYLTDEKRYDTKFRHFTVFLCDPSLQGAPSQTKYTKEDILENIDVENCRYDTISYEPNEYLLDDNTRMLIHTNITTILRTKLFDNKGDRQYHAKVDAKLTFTRPPRQ